MDGLKEKKLEGEKIDNLEGTSTSGESGENNAPEVKPEIKPELKPEVKPELNSSPVPTEEEKRDADLGGVDNSATDINAGAEAKVEIGNSGNVGSNEGGNDGGVEGGVEGEGDTPVATENVNAEGQPEPEPEKMFTQSQVNDLVGKTRMETREQTFRAVYGRYGVEDEAGMDELVGNAQRYETVRGEFDEARKGWEASDAAKANELTEVKEHVALLESGIDRARFDDARAIMKAKGLEITVENINNELATHPEWKGVKAEEPNPNFRPNPNQEPQDIKPTPEATIKVLGNEGNPSTGGMSEEEFALKNLFKL